MNRISISLVALSALLGATVMDTPLAQSSAEQAIAAARMRWEESPHGPMLARILPPTFQLAQLPEPDTRGAMLVVDYCVQCHNLPNPAMHHAKKWPGIVERMVVRMRGKGNLGTLMKEMMAGVKAPTDQEQAVLVAYLERYSQRPLDLSKYSDIESDQAKAFRLACKQCHTLPDPERYTAAEWPAVVARMEKNMLWMNRVVGSKPDPDEPQLRIEEILSYLQKHAAR
jgi:cytochrome c1